MDNFAQELLVSDISSVQNFKEAPPRSPPESFSAWDQPESSDASWDELEAYFKAGLVAQIRAHAANLRLPKLGLNYVRATLESPSRRVRSSTKSHAGVFQSTKMGASIGFESRTLELPYATVAENDDRVIAYLDQAPMLKVRYVRDGRNRSYHQTPDYLTVRDDGFVLVEGKPVEKLLERNLKDPGFYVQDGSTWICPALQDAARELGMTHEIWTAERFSLNRLRNLRMLSDYMAPSLAVAGYDRALYDMQRLLDDHVRMSVRALLDALKESVCVDHLYRALARLDIAFDFDEARLSDLEKCWVFRDMAACEAHAAIERCRAPVDRRLAGSQVEVARGASVSWNGVPWTCVNFAARTVTLRHGNDLEDLPRPTFDRLVDAGTIGIISQKLERDPEHDQVMARYAKASENDLRVANLRLRRIQRHLGQNALSPASRTERRYLANYRIAEERFGNGFIGLIPAFSCSGNRTPRMNADTVALVVEAVNEHYLNCKNANKKAVYGVVVDRCGEKSLVAPSYSWFCRFIDKMPPYLVALKRKGRKGAYPLEPKQAPEGNVDGAHAERPFEKCHVDHTLIDLETISGDTSEALGRVWLTILVDEDSRVVLAHHLTYDPPSYRSILMVLRKCVLRHGRLMDTLVCDGGKDMSSVWFETTCALYRVTILRRPIGKGRFGSTIERLFGTINTNFLHQLLGNTQLTKNVRQMTEEVLPSKHAVWTLPTLDKALSTYLYEVYETLHHRELLTTPRLRMERGLAIFGARESRRVRYDQLFIVTTSPSTPKGEARVTREGIKIFYLWYYHPRLQAHLRESLKVRYDPFDRAVAWAFVGGLWLELRARRGEEVSGVTEHELDLVTQEWRRRRSKVEKTALTESNLISFLKEIRETETLLKDRRRAAEERKVRDALVNEMGGVDDDDEELDDGTTIGPFDDLPNTDEPVVVELTAATKPAKRARTPALQPAAAHVFADVNGEFDTLEVL